MTNLHTHNGSLHCQHVRMGHDCTFGPKSVGSVDVECYLVGEPLATRLGQFGIVDKGAMFCFLSVMLIEYVARCRLT